MSKLGQLSLLAFGGLDGSITDVFHVKEKTYESGNTRQALTMRTRKEIAKDQGLTKKTDKVALDALILKEKDAVLGKMAEMITKLRNDPNWTGGGSVLTRNAKTGMLTLSMKAHTVERPPASFTDEQMAEALNNMGGRQKDGSVWTGEAVANARVAQLAKLAGLNVDADTQVLDDHTASEARNAAAAAAAA